MLAPHLNSTSIGQIYMANQPVHQLDIIRWAMQLKRHPIRVQSMGMRQVHEDDREWPDNQTFSCQFDDGRMITVEHRNWLRRAAVGTTRI